MAGRPTDLVSHLYSLAVTQDAESLANADAALALARAGARTLMTLSPQSALLMRSFAEEEITRLEMDCN